MFTGLIADLGRVAAVERDDAGASVEIETSLARELASGDSVAVDGVCLTVTTVGDRGFRAQAVPETLARSTLGALAAGPPVNLELPLRPADRLGGHVVQGHVDGVGRVVQVVFQGASRVLTIQPPNQLARYVVEKGSIAVNGVSLTVSALDERDYFPVQLSVALIPETLERTNLATLPLDARVNLEVDVLAKHVERLLQAHGKLPAPAPDWTSA